MRLRLPSVALVVVGGLGGAAAREAIDQALPTTTRELPTTTFLINLSGAFVLGLLLETLVRSGEDHGGRRRLRLVGGTGFCGAFTTYSTLAVELVQLGRHGAWSTAVVYLFISVLGGLAATALGITLAATHARWTVDRPRIDPDVDVNGEEG